LVDLLILLQLLQFFIVVLFHFILKFKLDRILNLRKRGLFSLLDSFQVVYFVFDDAVGLEPAELDLGSRFYGVAFLIVWADALGFCKAVSFGILHGRRSWDASAKV